MTAQQASFIIRTVCGVRVVLLILASVIITTFISAPVSAADSGGISAYNLPRTPDNAISTILEIVLNIAGALALLMIVISGLRYIFAGGDSGRVKKAKDSLIFALVGLILVVIARGIVTFVVDRI